MSIIRADSIKNRAGNGAPDFPNGITVTGIVTSTVLDASVTNLTVTGNLGVGGTITYEDVTNVDSVGVITARDGLRVTGIATITGDVSIADKIIHTGDTNTAIRFPAADTVSFETAGSERLRVSSSGQLGIGGANYGSSGQVLTSQGSGSAIQWATISTPLVAYKAKEYARNRYSFSNSTWAEIDNAFRIVHTPAATGNTIIIHTQVYHTIADNSYGGFANVTDQGSGSNESMLGETGSSSAIAKGSILGGNYYAEAIRQNSGGTIGLGSNLWGYHVTENTNAHTFFLFARMGSGTRYIGDNQPAQFMEMWEYSGNVMQ